MASVLKTAGWRVLVVWECELKKADKNDLFEKVMEFLKAENNSKAIQEIK